MKAFPNPQYREEKFNGMDLRDYFAAQIVNGFLANNKTDYSNKHIVELAYALADEMMKERAR